MKTKHKFINLAAKLSLFALIILTIPFFQSFVLQSEIDFRLKDPEITSDASGIHYTGYVTESGIFQLLDFIKSQQPKAPVVWFESSGGATEAAYAFVGMASHLNFETRVGKKGLCASACVIMFLAGPKHSADPTAAFGLHAPFCPDRLFNLTCRLTNDLRFEIKTYKAFFENLAPIWYEKAAHDHAFDRTGSNFLCYTLQNGDIKRPINAIENAATKENCALALDHYKPIALKNIKLGTSQYTLYDYTWEIIKYYGRSIYNINH